MIDLQAKPIKLTLSLRQMMKLVIFGAVASMSLAPMWRFAEAGVVTWPQLFFGEAVAIPMILAVAAFPLLRKGPRKDWMIRVLLTTSLGIGLVESIYAPGWASVGPPPLNVWAGMPRPQGSFGRSSSFSGSPS